MNRLLIIFKNGTYANVECAEMHDNEGIVKVYDGKCRLVAVFNETEITAAYISSKKEKE